MTLTGAGTRLAPTNRKENDMAQHLGGVTVTPGTRQLTARERIGWAGAQHERAQAELERTSAELSRIIVTVTPELTVSEIAELLGISATAVKNRIQRYQAQQ